MQSRDLWLLEIWDLIPDFWTPWSRLFFVCLGLVWLLGFGSLGVGMFWFGLVFLLSLPPLVEATVISNHFTLTWMHSPCWGESRVSLQQKGCLFTLPLPRLNWPDPDINQCSTSMEQVLRACIQPGAGHGAGSYSLLWDHVRGDRTPSYGVQWGDGAPVALASTLEVPAGQQDRKGLGLCPGLQGICQASFRSVKCLC